MRVTPLVFLMASLFAAAAHAKDTAAAERVLSVEFTATPAPRGEADMVRTHTTSSAVITYANGARNAR